MQLSKKITQKYLAMLQNINNKEIYVNSWEYLSDELKRLDLLIYLQVIRLRNKSPANPLEHYKGLIITEEEIFYLLETDVGQLTDKSLTNHNDSKNYLLMNNLNQLESQIQARRAVSFKEGVYLTLPHLSQLFHLTPFEEQCLIICLAPELDCKYEKLYAYLQDDVARKKPSVDLVLNLLCHTMQEKLKARLSFDLQSPMLRYRILQIMDSLPDGLTPLISRFLKLDDRIVNFLLGFAQVDARIESLVEVVSPQREWDEVMIPEDTRNRMQRFTRAYFGDNKQLIRQNVIFYFHGPYGSGKRLLAEAVCCDIGLPLIIFDVEKMLCGQIPFEEAIGLLCREAVLQKATLCLENFDSLLTDNEKHRFFTKSFLKGATTYAGLTVFLLGSRYWRPQGLLKECIFIDLELPIPDDKARKRFWDNSFSGHFKLAGDVDLDILASKFRFTPGQIQDALIAAQNLACWRSTEDNKISSKDLYTACRAQSNQKLRTLARKIESGYTWDDIVLPSDQLAQLREICNQVTYRHIVYGEWGFDRKLSLGKGLNVLFSGPSGTGKTMAAGIIAQELCFDLYKIDLSQVVSKYIGETEKNLDKIFTEAQTSNAILFFDEADALFGKRSEVKDAHDRYANIEIGYLLQKMEEYDGIAILATNLQQNMDEAFVRRIQVIVEFPFPDEEHRRCIWKVIFPREAPLGDDIDFSILAREIKLPGGNIKNIALAAAFFAAEDSDVIRMPYLLQAARREYQKLGRIWNEVGWNI